MPPRDRGTRSRNAKTHIKWRKRTARLRISDGDDYGDGDDGTEEDPGEKSKFAESQVSARANAESRLLLPQQHALGRNARKKAFTKFSRASRSESTLLTRRDTSISPPRWNVHCAFLMGRSRFLTALPAYNRNRKQSGVRRPNTTCRVWRSSTRWIGWARTSRCPWTAFTKNSARTHGRFCCRWAGKTSCVASST